MVEHLVANQMMGVRFSLPALKEDKRKPSNLVLSFTPSEVRVWAFPYPHSERMSTRESSIAYSERAKRASILTRTEREEKHRKCRCFSFFERDMKYGHFHTHDERP